MEITRKEHGLNFEEICFISSFFDTETNKERRRREMETEMDR